MWLFTRGPSCGLAHFRGELPVTRLKAVLKALSDVHPGEAASGASVV